MEVWIESRSVAFYRNTNSFWIDASITQRSDTTNPKLIEAIRENKTSIKFTPDNPKEFSWITTWPYLVFQISHSETKKTFAKSGNQEYLVATEVTKCELFKATS